MTISLIGAERALTEQIPPARRRFAVVAVVAVLAVGLAYGVSRIRSDRCSWTAPQFQTAWRDLKVIGDHLAADTPLDEFDGIAVAAPTRFVAGSGDPERVNGWCASAEGHLRIGEPGNEQALRWALSTYRSASSMTEDLDRIRSAAPSVTAERLAVPGCRLVLATSVEPAPNAAAEAALAEALARRVAPLCRTW